MNAPARLLTGEPARSVFLMQDTIYCAPEPTWIATVLGSCVAVCLWDAARHCGGMNHYLLPRCNVPEPSARYGDVAVDLLVEGMLGMGCRVGNLQAKIFGGAAVLPYGAVADTVGDGNVRVAREILARWRIPIVVSRTGGTNGLQVRFDTESGDVLIRGISSGHSLRSCPGGMGRPCAVPLCGCQRSEGPHD